MKISVCVPTVRPTTLSYTVRSIIAQTWPDWELLIVGQGEDPDLARVGRELEALDARIRYLHIDERGLSRARNAGLAAATGDVIAMTDDDCEADPNWLETMARLFTEHPAVGMVGGALIAAPVSRLKLESCLGFTPDEFVYDPASGQTPPPAWGWIGANFALRREAVERVGMFDDYLGAGAPDFPAGEDTDYNMRVLAAGIGVACSPALIVRHTYGARRGLRQNLRTIWSYARGNAGLDGKLTLAGNPHGQKSASQQLHETVRDALNPRKVYKLPITLGYALVYQTTYRKCLRAFRIDTDGRLIPNTVTQQAGDQSLAPTTAR